MKILFAIKTRKILYNLNFYDTKRQPRGMKIFVILFLGASYKFLNSIKRLDLKEIQFKSNKTLKKKIIDNFLATEYFYFVSISIIVLVLHIICGICTFSISIRIFLQF